MPVLTPNYNPVLTTLKKEPLSVNMAIISDPGEPETYKEAMSCPRVEEWKESMGCEKFNFI
jgi:hypothetical protein